MEEVYKKIINKLNRKEKENVRFLLLIDNNFIKYNKVLEKDNLCLNVKIKENRTNDFFDILDSLNIQYSISNDTKFYKIIELNKDSNYIVIDYVVDSHVTIPQSFLNLFGHKEKDGFYVDYIDYKDSMIKSKKAKEYGTIYGYYDKIIEDRLSSVFETNIGIVRKKLFEFYKGNIKTMELSDRKEIMDFVDITSFRNPKTIEEFNKISLTSVLTGGYDQNYILDIIMTGKYPNIYKDLEINFIINKTDANFIINDTLISNIRVDNGNEIIIIPISPKIAIVLMEKDYFKKYMINGYFYYMRIDNPKEVEEINQEIYKYASKNKENVIGAISELNKLL